MLTILMMATALMPPTVTEEAMFGSSPDRVLLVQTRIVKAMMNIAPNQAVAFFAQATNMPEDTIRIYLEAKADGTFMAQSDAPLVDTTRFVGGAKFIKVD